MGALVLILLVSAAGADSARPEPQQYNASYQMVKRSPFTGEGPTWRYCLYKTSRDETVMFRCERSQGYVSGDVLSVKVVGLVDRRYTPGGTWIRVDNITYLDSRLEWDGNQCWVNDVCQAIDANLVQQPSVKLNFHRGEWWQIFQSTTADLEFSF